MSTTEIIGVVVIGLTAVITLFLYIINSFSKYMSDPYKRLTEAIEKLNISITLLNANDENMKIALKENKEVLKDHGRMITDIYNRIASMEFNCAYIHNNPLRKDWRELGKEINQDVKD